MAVGAFEFGNLAATLLILRATDLLTHGRSHSSAVQLALVLYTAYNVAATLGSIPPEGPATASGASEYSGQEQHSSLLPTSG